MPIPDAIAERIRELRADGLTFGRIAAYLNRKGVKPAKADLWSPEMVRNVHERATDTLSSRRGSNRAASHVSDGRSTAELRDGMRARTRT